ncbi:hypothetical protein QYF61_002375 [Mycteria americana]|uniref:Uncharacterized protein n=1 Tax=Mycteria americana TaxID=33587 RepID=A0AAN7NJ14_MYCAM|nr:hypothetical protein QYF61_002375 [Mycteria americana]
MKKFFTIRVVKHWHRLPREVADAPSLETFKVSLEQQLMERHRNGTKYEEWTGTGAHVDTSEGHAVGFFKAALGVSAQALAVGAAGAASVRRGRGCPMPDTAGSSRFQSAPRDPPQGTAETVSQGGGASVITYLRKDKKSCAAAVREKRKKTMGETSLQTPMSEKKEGEED